MRNTRAGLTVSSHLIISRAILLVIIGGLAIAFFKYLGEAEPDPVVREYYDCIASVCLVLDGAGDACVVSEPRMAKITIVADDTGKAVKVSPSKDRCD